MHSKSDLSRSRFIFQIAGLFSLFCSFFAQSRSAQATQLTQYTEYKAEEFFSFTGVGAGILSQGFEISRRFVRPPENDGSYFLNRREKSLAEAKKVKHYLPLSWVAGGGFTLLSSPALGSGPGISGIPGINDTVISFKAGLNWTPVPSFNTTLDLDIDTLPAESYNHGAVLFKFWQTISLNSHAAAQASREPASTLGEHPEEAESVESPGDYESTEADQYYKAQGKLTNDDDGFVQFPEIKLGLILGFGEHLIASKAYRNTSLGSLVTAQKLFQNRTGVELAYSPTAAVTVRLGANVFFYSEKVDSYLSYLEIGKLQRMPLFAKTGWSASTNQLLSFPGSSFDQGFEFDVNEKEKFELLINETFYPSTQQSTLISAMPCYTRKIGKGWRVSLDPFIGLLLSEGGIFSGMVKLTYELGSAKN